MNTTIRIVSAILLALWLWVPLSAQDGEQTEQPAEDTAAEAGGEPGASGSSLPEPAAQVPSLEQAYQKEFAFLQGQKRDLERRLAEFRETAETERTRLNNDIRRLEREVVEMGGRADRLDDLVFESERAVETARENTDLLSTTFLQADTTLDDWEAAADVAENTPGAEDVSALFGAADNALARAGRVTRTEGEFFLADGTRVSGSLIHLGNIASFGLSDRGGGALAPAGEGELKVWNAESAEAARTLAAGNAPDPVPVFIYESLNSEVEQSQGKGFFGTISDGGVIGWIIFFLGLLALTLIILRALFLWRASASTSKIIDAVSGHIKRGDREAALSVLKRQKGSTARVVAAAIRNLDYDREHLEDIISEAILHERGHLNRFGAFIMVIAAVAPLLGLLGTVTGMISTFDVITEFGTGDPKLLSGGISIALITTEMGLIVAIPTLLLGNLLSSWAERITDDMEKAALHVTNQFMEARAGVEREAA